MVKNANSTHVWVLFLIAVSCFCLAPQAAVARSPYAYGVYEGIKKKTPQDPRHAALFVTLAAYDDALEGSSEGVFILPPGSYCDLNGKFSFVLLSPKEFSYRVELKGKIDPGSGVFSAQAKGKASGSVPDWTYKPEPGPGSISFSLQAKGKSSGSAPEGKGWKNVELALEGIFKGKALRYDMEGDLSLSARGCGVGKWVKSGPVTTQTVRPHTASSLSFAGKVGPGNQLTVDTTEKFQKRASDKPRYVRHHARFTWKLKKHEKGGGLLPWRYLEGDFSIYTKNGVTDPGGKASVMPGGMGFYLCGKTNPSELVSGYYIDGNKDGTTLTRKVKIIVPHWGHYQQHCKGAGDMTLTTSLTDRISGGSFARRSQSYLWQSSGRDKQFAEADKLHLKAKVPDMEIKVCPRLRVTDTKPSPAFIYAHPDFPARMEMFLPAAHRVVFSLPPRIAGPAFLGRRRQWHPKPPGNQVHRQTSWQGSEGLLPLWRPAGQAPCPRHHRPGDGQAFRPRPKTDC